MARNRWQLVEAIFLEASTRSPEDRERFVRERCAGDDELCFSVLKLIANDGTASGGLDSMVAKAAVELAAEDPWIGRRVGSYEIRSLIGRGGMGSVYRAERDDDFRKEAAVKILNFSAADEHARKRFRRERQILAPLEHPNIARLLDGGSTLEGTPYLVMEYIDGRPLLVHCETLSRAKQLELFGAICDAVQYAHQKLVIHRDIKPGNILVDRSGSPKLLDFGIAKLAEADTQGELESPSTNIMTPEYASPEQVRGEPVSVTTDVYALGCVLYEIFTGKRMHRLSSRDPLEIARAVCHAETPPPSSTGAKDLRGDLDNIVLKAVQKDPARRYQSVERLREDIGRYLDGRPVLARPDSFAYRAVKFAKRNRLSIAAAAAVTVALAAGFVSTWHQAQIAERRFNQVRGLANKLMFDFYDRIASLPGAMEARTAVVNTALEYLDALSKESANDPGLQWELSEAYTRVAQVQGFHSVSAGRFQDSLATISKALALQESLLRRGLLTQEQKEKTVGAYQNLTQWSISALQRPAAKQSAEKAMALSEGLSPGARARALDAMGQAEAAMGDLPSAVKRYGEAIALWRSVVTASSPVADTCALGYALMRRSRLLNFLGRLEEALAGYEEERRWIDLDLARFPHNVQVKQHSLLNYEMIGTLLGLPDRPNLGRRKEGMAMLDKAIDVAREQSAGDPTSGALIRVRALLWGKRGAMQTDTRLALADLEKCGDLIESMPDEIERAELRMSYLGDKAQYLDKLNRPVEARAALVELARVAESQLERRPDNPTGVRVHGEALVELASFDVRHGRRGDAGALFERGLDRLRQADRMSPTDARYITALASGMESQARSLENDPAKARVARQAIVDLLTARLRAQPDSKPVGKLLAQAQAALAKSK
ncbi:MAG: serine/threonine-protein kinase [Bryobacteraceae bacterium]|nr:serine/threonine-protein kinase [Bryobacteraceae bacterium]